MLGGHGVIAHVLVVLGLASAQGIVIIHDRPMVDHPVLEKRKNSSFVTSKSVMSKVIFEPNNVGISLKVCYHFFFDNIRKYTITIYYVFIYCFHICKSDMKSGVNGHN